MTVLSLGHTNFFLFLYLKAPNKSPCRVRGLHLDCVSINMNTLLIIFLARSPSYANSEPIYVKVLLANIKILLFHLISNLHMYIFKF